MSSNYKIPSKCNNIVKFLPVITPQINSLSSYSSVSGVYTIISIVGNHFRQNGYSVVNFGAYKNLPIIFLGSQNISFQVPTIAAAGTYNVFVENKIYPTQLYSNSVIYTIT